MARPNQEAVDTFISITGASEAAALQILEEHGGDLNEAVNSHFTQRDRNIIHPAPVAAIQNDFMDIDDDSVETGSQRPPFPLSATPDFNPFSLLDPNFHRGGTLGGSSVAELTSTAPRVTHPRVVREIPIEVKDNNAQPSHSGLSPAIEDVTGTAYAHGPETHGTIIIDDDDNDEVIQTAGRGHSFGQVESFGGRSHGTNLTPSAPAIDSVVDYHNDIEEEMIQAAIEASKREVVEAFPNHQIDVSAESSGPSVQQTESHVEDTDIARAVSLSLKTAEQEKALREQGGSTGMAEKNVSASDIQELGNPNASNERQGVGTSNEASLKQPKLETGSSSVRVEDDAEEQPFVRQRSRRVNFGSDSVKEALEMEESPPLSPEPHNIDSHPQNNGTAFQSDEWGGMSSLEHDEAVMLEAALFGGIPEGAAYRFGYPLQERTYSRPALRPPSPTLEAQRLLREQQDDEYLASLQADREKELKAVEEAEAQRLSEEAAKEAALEEEKRKEEETRRKIMDKEETERQLAAKEASLPVEPPTGDDNAINLLVRMPDGSRRGRRFLKSDNLQSLFDFIDVGRGVKPGTYRLVRPYPRRAFSDNESKLSLSELGLTSKQEALFLELI